MQTAHYFIQSVRRVSLFAILGLAALLSSACAQRGLSAFSPDGENFAIITDDGRLIVADPIGIDQLEITAAGELRPGFGVSFSPDGQQIAYVTVEGGLCTTNLVEGNRRCVSMPPGINSGLVSHAPNGNTIFILANGTQWIVQLFTPSGSQVTDQSYSGIDHAFFPQALVKQDNISGSNSWRIRPGQVIDPQFVFIRSGQAERFQLTEDGLIELGATELVLTQEMLSALQQRDLTNISSGALSQNGQYIMWRTTDGRLLLLDLSTPDAAIKQLATGAVMRFAFSPDSQTVTWSDTTGVWIADSNGDNATLANSGGELAGWAP